VALDENRTCCFTGHRPDKLPWGLNDGDPRCAALKLSLERELAGLYRRGWRHFISGMAMGCDLYFAEAVLALREARGDVSLEAAVPCPTQADGWPPEQRARYRRLLDACDFETLVSNRYTPYCMQRRDRYMVDHASLLIAVFDGTPGGTRYTMEYAISRRIFVVDLPVV